jgi:hypothetical protein
VTFSAPISTLASFLTAASTWSTTRGAGNKKRQTNSHCCFTPMLSLPRSAQDDETIIDFDIMYLQGHAAQPHKVGLARSAHSFHEHGRPNIQPRSRGNDLH